MEIPRKRKSIDSLHAGFMCSLSFLRQLVFMEAGTTLDG